MNRSDKGQAEGEDHSDKADTSNKDQDKDPKRRIEEIKDLEGIPEVKKQKIDRFEIEEITNEWELPDELAAYAKKYMNCFLTEKQIEEAIGKEFPVPSNVSIEKELDSYLRSILNERKQKQCLSMDKAFQEIQKKIGLVYGPLTTLWNYFENERNFTKSVEDSDENVDELESTLDSQNELCNVIEMSITLLGQAFNTSSYYRRRNILSAIVHDRKQVKEILKDNVKVFQESEDGNLFGKQFDEKVLKEMKQLKKSKEYLGLLATDDKGQSSRSSGSSRPFRGDLRSSFNGQGSRGYSRGTFRRPFVRRGGKSSFTFTSLLTSCRNSANQELSKSPSTCKMPFSGRYSKKPAIGRTNSLFSPKLGGFNKRSGYSKHNQGVQDSIYIPSTTKGTSKSSKTRYRGEEVGGPRNRNDAIQRSNKKGFSREKSVFKQSIFSGQKRRRQQASYKSEESKRVCRESPFQNGRFISSERALITQRLDVQGRSEGCLFFNSYPSEFSEISTFRMARFSLSVPLPVL